MKTYFLFFALLTISVANCFGQTWTQVTSPVISPDVLYSISFKDSTNGIAGGGAISNYPGAHTLVKSIGDGSSWSNINATFGDEIVALKYFPSGNIYAATIGISNSAWNYFSGLFVKSNDNGSSFYCSSFPQASLYSDSATFTPIKMFFLDTLHGYVCGYYNRYDFSYGYSQHGAVLRTGDAGATWQILPTAIFYFSGGSFGSTDVQFNDITFVNYQKGFLLGANDSLYWTVDSGNTWVKSKYLGPQTMNSIYFWNANSGWITGNSGILWQTNDGGTTWLPVSTPTGNALTKITFTDSINGWLVAGTTIYHSIDGGATWNISDTFSVTINDIYMISNDEGFAVGDANIYKYFSADSTTGIKELAFNHLSVSPNPAKNLITVNMPGNNFDYELYDITGRLLFNNRNNQDFVVIDVHSLSEGIYTLSIKTATVRITRKIVKD